MPLFFLAFDVFSSLLVCVCSPCFPAFAWVAFAAQRSVRGAAICNPPVSSRCATLTATCMPGPLPLLQSILDSAWSPTFNAALLDALGGRRVLLVDM